MHYVQEVNSRHERLDSQLRLQAAAAGQAVRHEVNTVIGLISGKLLFTMTFPETGLSIAFLGDKKSSQICTRIFNMLWVIAGPGLFRKLFLNSLTDNGTEFSDPVMIENYRPDPVHNPTKLLPRGIHVWFADPYCSSQKPHIERFHNELRRILQKGTSFDPLTQKGPLEAKPDGKRRNLPFLHKDRKALHSNHPLKPSRTVCFTTLDWRG